MLSYVLGAAYEAAAGAGQVNPEWYGCKLKCDVVTDDTAALQRLVNLPQPSPSFDEAKEREEFQETMRRCMGWSNFRRSDVSDRIYQSVIVEAAFDGWLAARRPKELT